MKSTQNLKLLTKGQIIPHLKDSFSQAGESIFIVGPWLDAYFTRIIIESVNRKDIAVKFLVRVDEGAVDQKTLSALNYAKQNLTNFQARSLENLHTKVILIDEEVFFLGSANWYWYSLHESLEMVINGNTKDLPGLIPELSNYWEKATPLKPDDLIKFEDFQPRKRI